MSDSTTKYGPVSVRSTQPDFVPQQAFQSVDDELLYYKREYQRLKAIIALQKQKIRKLLPSGR